MELRGKRGDAVRLKVVGYQFPQITHERYDADWLNIEVVATVRGRRWRSIDPSLLTWEIIDLADWLDAVVRGEEKGVDFLEPNLRFELIGRRNAEVRLRVYFELESRPPWARADGASRNDLWAELEATSEDLIAAAADLRAQLERSPGRAKNGPSVTRDGPGGPA